MGEFSDEITFGDKRILFLFFNFLFLLLLFLLKIIQCQDFQLRFFIKKDGLAIVKEEEHTFLNVLFSLTDQWINLSAKCSGSTN